MRYNQFSQSVEEAFHTKFSKDLRQTYWRIENRVSESKMKWKKFTVLFLNSIFNLLGKNALTAHNFPITVPPTTTTSR